MSGRPDVQRERWDIWVIRLGKGGFFSPTSPTRFLLGKFITQIDLLFP